MQKNVLVTGANGFVGNHLLKELTANGYVVSALGGNREGPLTTDLFHTYTMVDLTDPAAVAAIDLSGIDGIIHLAGIAAVGPSFADPMGYITKNIGMQVNLFEAALQQSVTPRFIIVSSGSVYDASQPLPFLETSPVAPTSPYAVSKLGQEQMAHYYATRGFEVLIARPFNHIGPGQKTGFIVPDLMQQVMTYKQGNATHISVGNLDAERDYTDVRDIVRAYRLLLESGTSGEIYNVCSGVPISGHDLLATILKETDCNPTITEDPTKMRPSDTPKLVGSHEKLSSATQWEPSYSIDATLRDALSDYQATASV